MITDQQIADHFYFQEYTKRMEIEWRTEELLERARQQIMHRIKHYPKGMRAQAHLYIETLHQDMCKEDTERQTLIGQQQHYLRLAQAYQIRANRGHA